MARSAPCIGKIGGRWCALVAAGALAACGRGTPAAHVRPPEISAVEAIEGPPKSATREVPRCAPPQDRGDPLVVDWRPEDRGSLELAMRDALAVVKYGCDGIRVLDGCHLRGSYGFAGFSRKEQVVRLENEDEARANLPFSGASLGARIGGELARGATLEIALVLVGRARTTRVAARARDLEGPCDDATHFVRGAFVGAFAIDTGSRAHVRTAVEVLGAGGGAASASRRHAHQRDGSLATCGDASSAKRMPRGCALVRLQLTAIEQTRKKDDEDQLDDVRAVGARAGAAKAPAAPPLLFVDDDESCPEGLVLAAGKCAPAASAPVHVCEARDMDACRAQCAAGDTESCFRLGRLHEAGIGGPRDAASARKVFADACRAGSARACAGEGLLLARGEGGARDEKRAFLLFSQSCEGVADACLEAASAAERGVGTPRDLARAASLYERACDAGAAVACGKLALLALDGRGVARDRARATALFERACDGAVAAACDKLRGLRGGAHR